MIKVVYWENNKCVCVRGSNKYENSDNMKGNILPVSMSYKTRCKETNPQTQIKLTLEK